MRLRQAFLHRLDALQKARHAIIQGLTGSAPSSFRNRASAVAQLGVRSPPPSLTGLNRVHIC